MKLHEVAKQQGAESKDVIAHLNQGVEGDDVIKTHLVSLTDEQVESVVKAFPIDKPTSEEDPTANPEPSELDIELDGLDRDGLINKIKDMNKTLTDVQYLANQQEGELAELESENEDLKAELKRAPKKEPTKAPAEKKPVSKEEIAKLTKGLSEAEITKIKESIRAIGTKSKYWDKYSKLAG